ncbi:MAG: phosphoribosylanthranilate isomerase [Chlorobiaceae bacterium]|nr:phosphoribosylanthranilate isomerase [Chlorobiaceae bacterium]
MTKIKICGITRNQDALDACLAGADALGFNFSNSSPRAVRPDVAKKIIKQLPPLVTAVGIFVEQTPDEISDLCAYCGLQVAQLHSDAYSPEQALLVRGAKVLRVFRPGPDFRIEEVREFADITGYKGFLFDAFNPQMAGGTGESIESSTAVQLFEQTRNFAWTLLAGGLKPENVGAAVRLVRPWGVDTASGVESAPGIKDPIKTKAFIEAVRDADRAIRSCF